MQKMEIVYLSPGELTPYEKNAKRHPPKQVEQIANSIKQFGWRQPIVVDKDKTVIIGHGRLFAAKEMGGRKRTRRSSRRKNARAVRRREPSG